MAVSAQAGSSTWTVPTEYPSDSTGPWPDWNDASHWAGGIIPNGVSDVATFDALISRLNFRITDFTAGAANPGEATTITLGGLVHTGAGRLDTRPYGPISTIVWNNGASNAFINDTFNGELLLAHNHVLTSTIEIPKGGGQTRLQRVISGPGGIILSGAQEFVLGETGTPNTFTGGFTILDTSRLDLRKHEALGVGPLTFASTSTTGTLTPRGAWAGALANAIVVEAGGVARIREESNSSPREFSGAFSGGGALILQPKNSLWKFTGENTITGGMAVQGNGTADVAFGVEGVFNTASSIELSNAAVLHITSENVIDDTIPVTLDAASVFNVATSQNEGLASGALTVGGAVIDDGTYDNNETWIVGDGTVTVGVGSVAFAITDFSLVGDVITLTWNSRPNVNYILKYTPDMTDWLSDVSDSIIGGPGAQTTISFDLSEHGIDINLFDELFFRMEK